MTRDETVALFLECEAKRAEARAAALAGGKSEDAAEAEAHEAAKAHWNAWAQKMLAERKALEAAGRWAAEKNSYEKLEPKNEESCAWMKAAEANFSRSLFLVRGAEGTEEEKEEDEEEEEESDESKLPFKSIQLEGDDTDFSGFIFPGYASFERATFSGFALFDNATFFGDAGFARATFDDRAYFEGATFTGTASFASAAFTGPAWFASATFAGNASFESATFTGDAWFDTAAFSGDARFKSATFSGSARFESAIFTGSASFDSATFTGDASFVSATFSDIASFVSATFSGGASFSSASFTGIAWFKSTTFTGEARFVSATFTGNASFLSATFTGDASFLSATFTGDALFIRATFSGIALFLHATFQNSTSFEQAEFQKGASFAGVKADRAFYMTGATFEEVPAFNPADFKQSPDLDAVDFPLPGFWRRGEAGLIPHYRAIRRMAIQGADYEREQMAFKGETRSKRGTEHKPWHTAFWFGIAYDALSDYGRSIARPLAIWVASALAFAAIYAWNAGVAVSGWGSACADDGASKALKALTLSAANALPLIGSSRSEVAREFYTECLALPHAPAWSPILQIGQTLWSAVLLFLFLLALRNQFKIK